MRKLWALGFTLLIFCSRVYAQTGENIENLNTHITINADGTIDVEERIDYNFGAEQKHGIFREIPKIKENQEGKKFILDFDNISVNAPYTDNSTSQELNLKIGDPNQTLTGKHTYIIGYKVAGALTYFEDHDELYWNITGNYWNIPIRQASVKVTLPSEIPSSKTAVVCYTGIKGSTAQSCTSFIQNNTLETTTSKSLGANEGLTIAVKFPKGFVAQLEPKEAKPSIWTYVLISLIALLAIGWFVIAPASVFLKWLKDYLHTKKTSRIVAAWFDPPKNENKTFYTPAETGALIDKNVDHKDITATIIHLAQKGFLTIHVDEKEILGFKTHKISFKKTKNFEEDFTLTSYETELLEGIFSKNYTVSADSLKTSTKFGKAMKKFREKVAAELFTKELFEKDLYKTERSYRTLSILAAMTFNIPLALISSVWGIKSTKRTDLGTAKYSEAKSLKNFLESQEEQLDFQAKNQMFFEKLLPYATAFGVEKVWAEKFKDIEFVKPDWYEGDFNNFVAISALSHSLDSSINSAMTSTGSTSSSGFSSGFSGGSSGGGGGGGGGGSW